MAQPLPPILPTTKLAASKPSPQPPSSSLASRVNTHSRRRWKPRPYTARPFDDYIKRVTETVHIRPTAAEATTRFQSVRLKAREETLVHVDGAAEGVRGEASRAVHKARFRIHNHQQLRSAAQETSLEVQTGVESPSWRGQLRAIKDANVHKKDGAPSPATQQAPRASAGIRLIPVSYPQGQVIGDLLQTSEPASLGMRCEPTDDDWPDGTSVQDTQNRATSTEPDSSQEAQYLATSHTPPSSLNDACPLECASTSPCSEISSQDVVTALGCALGRWGRHSRPRESSTPRDAPSAVNPASRMLAMIRSESQAREKAGMNMYWARMPERKESSVKWDEDAISLARPLEVDDVCVIFGTELDTRQCKILSVMIEGLFTVEVLDGPASVKGALRTLPAKHLQRLRRRKVEP